MPSQISDIDTSGLPPAMTEEEARLEIVLFTEAASDPKLSDEEVDFLLRKAKRADYLQRNPSMSNWRPTWNLAHSIALGWQIKSARLAGVTSFSIKGQSFNSREKFYDHCLEQMGIWRSRSAETITMEGSWRRKIIGTQTSLTGVQTNGYLEDDYLP